MLTEAKQRPINIKNIIMPEPRGSTHPADEYIGDYKPQIERYLAKQTAKLLEEEPTVANTPPFEEVFALTALVTPDIAQRFRSDKLWEALQKRAETIGMTYWQGLHAAAFVTLFDPQRAKEKGFVNLPNFNAWIPAAYDYHPNEYTLLYRLWSLKIMYSKDFSKTSVEPIGRESLKKQAASLKRKEGAGEKLFSLLAHIKAVDSELLKELDYDLNDWESMWQDMKDRLAKEKRKGEIISTLWTTLEMMIVSADEMKMNQEGIHLMGPKAQSRPIYRTDPLPDIRKF